MVIRSNSRHGHGHNRFVGRKRLLRTTTLGDIQRTGPDKAKTTPETLEAIEQLIRGLEELAARSRRQSLSMLVPMGQEMAYRYQEGVIYETIAVLRDFLVRCRA